MGRGEGGGENTDNHVRLFRHYDEFFITSSGYDCERTRRLDSVRSRIERRIGRLSTFRILSTTYRSENYEFHADVVNVLCRMINLVNL